MEGTKLAGRTRRLRPVDLGQFEEPDQFSGVGHDPASERSTAGTRKAPLGSAGRRWVMIPSIGMAG